MPQLLIIQTAALGDIVQGLRVAASMKAERPDLRISFVAKDVLAPLVRSCEAIDQTYVFQREGGVVGFWGLLRELREIRFDQVFDFQGLLRTGLMTWRVRATQKVGRTDAREYATLFYGQKAVLPAAGRRSPLIEKLLQFGPLVEASKTLHGELTFRAVNGLNLDHLNGPGGSAPIVMFLDSRRAEKRWPGFKQLTDLILRGDRRRKVVWAGTNYVPDKDAFLPEQFLNLTGNTSLVALPSLVKRASWVISNENGPMHLTAALNVPLLAIFGPSDPQLFGPYPGRESRSHVIQAPVGDLRLLGAKEVYARFRRLAAGMPVG